jgi:ferrous iron transport protein B
MTAVLVGQPNVGKSLVLMRLTGAQVVVSNYPNTSLELTKGELKVAGKTMQLLDTPGVYSLGLAQREEEAARAAVLDQATELIINVVDATNLARNLALTLELRAAGKPLLVLLNQIDRARTNGIFIDPHKLARMLGCPVFAFSALTGEGIMEVMKYLQTGLTRGFSPPIAGSKPLVVDQKADCDGNCRHCFEGELRGGSSPEQAVCAHHQLASLIAEMVTTYRPPESTRGLTRVEKFIDHPWWGTFSLLVLLFLGFEILISFVEWAEDGIVELFVPIQELLASAITWLMPPGFWSQVLSKGVPEGLLIPIALVMPAMLMVSVLMALLEDTGLLARYAVVLDRVGGLLGVSGQAVIPLSLGFGCRTPAVLATRVLPSTGQRFIITTLLSIVIPCAATLGMLAAVIASFDAWMAVIILTMVAVFIILGGILKNIYQEKSELLYELPPLRIPMVRNLASKVRIRFAGFFTEVLPLLLVMSVGVRIIIDSGVLNHVQALDGVTRGLFGIPAQAFTAVLVTIVQRYLAPLVLLNLQLSPREATIAISMIALSLPCLPVVVITWREMGGRALTRILAMGLAVSFSVGVVLNLLLPV